MESLYEDRQRWGKKEESNTQIMDQYGPLLGHKSLPLLFPKKDILQKKPQQCIILDVLRINHLVVLKISFQHVDSCVSLSRAVKLKISEPRVSSQ